MQFVPHLHFNGQCEEAFKFYERCFGGKIQNLSSYAAMPGEAHVPADWRDKVMHATLAVGDQLLMGCDPPPGRFQPPAGFSVAIQLNDVAAGERIFKALAESGKVTMPFQKTFWSPGFGMVDDRFGIGWMINCTQAAQQQSA
ncbi:MAG TPA: VOC family protein [Candidatus Acidoferrales bacterium]|nr:VOC family protein [Candidatus Acidoferrales bacterium]